MLAESKLASCNKDKCYCSYTQADLSIGTIAFSLSQQPFRKLELILTLSFYRHSRQTKLC